jgi:DNA helicase II / ATP-dependent DNA helicase PcrA
VRLQEIAEEVRNVEVLDRGTYLRQALTRDWRKHGEYRNALAIRARRLYRSTLLDDRKA